MRPTRLRIYLVPRKLDNSSATVPKKGWFAIFRLYGPLEPWFDNTWPPREIELVK